VHTVALQLAPVLAEGKSKLPFYIAGGVLVAWALIVSIGIGMRRPNFPQSPGQQRAIMAVSAVLVLFAVAMAVVTAGGEGKVAKASAQTPATQSPTGAAEGPTSQPTATTGPPAPSSTPKATTGTPPPPSSPAAGPPTKLALAADTGGQLAYDKKSLSAKAGTVAIAFTNASPIEHDVTVAQGASVVGATPTFIGGSKTATLTLKPGTYTFYCSVPGHRQAGMEGTLTVTP
jgi:plastocyanin